MEFEQLKRKVLDWADKRDLLHEKNKFKQWGKTYEEVGEIFTAMLDDDREAVMDGIGDTIVTLIILEKAYDEIKDRKGKTVNGEFVKD